MKSILLHIDHDPAMQARLQVALDIARATNGHVTCLQAVSYEVFAPGAIYGSAIAAAMPVIKAGADKLRAFDVGAPMLVAWNGSAEGAHALRAAMPLLACSCKVTLACVIEADERARFDLPSTDGAKYLARHGIDCEIVEIPRGEASIADTLFSAAQMRECGLMVMGAYGHSRLAELLLGGVTRQMLSEPQMPVLLAH